MVNVLKLIRDLRQRILLVVGRGVVQRIDDSGGVQQVQATFLSDEVHDKMEHMQAFGFVSHPPKGAEAVALFRGGRRETGVVICVAHRQYRLSALAEGAVAIHDQAGNKIVLNNDGTVDVDAATINLNGAVNISGDVIVDGKVSAANVEDNIGTLAAFRTAYNSHVHTANGTSPPVPTA